nr:Putative DNA-binding protein [Kibdelosporangium sp. MJ126-NF4]CTQ94096.1 Putative DNA-binding protein [Kibdelosporangium sp. MJ126-NF4]
MRERSGHTLVTAAAELDKTRSALQRIESGQTKADVHLARSMMDLYDCRDLDLVDEVRRANQPSLYHSYGFKGGGSYLDVEAEANHVDELATHAIPGILQTDQYMRSLFGAHGYSAKKHGDFRAARHARLTSEEHPLTFTTVIDEAVLLREVGGLDVMRQQLLHIAAATTLPTVKILVLPLKLGAYPAMPGSFNLLRFPDPEFPDYLYIEHVTGTIHTEDNAEVRKARLIFRKLLSLALGPAESVALIERLAMEAFGGSSDLAKE